MSVDGYLDYLVNFKDAVSKEDSVRVCKSVSFLGHIADLNSCPDYSELAVKYEPGRLFAEGGRVQDPEHWGQLMVSYFELIHELKALDFGKAIAKSEKMVNEIVRCAQHQGRWICLPMMTVSTELRQLAFIYMSSGDYDAKENGEYGLDDQLANTLQRPFKVCVGDKSDEKKWCVYFFADELFKTYTKFGKYDAAQNLVKVLRGSPGLPSLENVPKSHSVTYRYFCALLEAMELGRLGDAAKQLNTASVQCLKEAEHNEQMILQLLAPLNFLEHRVLPSEKLATPYRAVYKALKAGDLHRFDEELRANRGRLLAGKTLALYTMMRPYVELRLLAKVAHFYDGDRKHIVPLSWFQRGLQYSARREYTIEEVESRLAAQIAQGHIKGYISHGNGVVVLSRQNGFPREVTHPCTI